MNQKIWLPLALFSLTLHVALFLSLISLSPNKLSTEDKRKSSVKIKIAEKIPTETIPEKPLAPPPKPLPKPKPKAPEPITERAFAKPVDSKPVKPVGGLSKESFAEGETNSQVSAPVGNTLLSKRQADPGEKIEKITADLSADAQLIKDSFEAPEYTNSALDAEIEGKFVVDVYIDAKGNVQQAELRKKIGYGMDERVLEVAKKARFVPRKNQFGEGVPAWSEIIFRLEIP
ncbi:MAG: TonB family protein [Oligoflexales bacterium]|nr:TonB family protein [Oligoflexales bacterium]